MTKAAIISEIGHLKQRLKDTDYIALKYAEGELTLNDYIKTKEQRRAWRDRINVLEQAYKDLGAK